MNNRVERNLSPSYVYKQRKLACKKSIKVRKYIKIFVKLIGYNLYSTQGISPLIYITRQYWQDAHLLLFDM